MKKLIYTLILACGLSQAAPLPQANIDAMVAHSESVMKQGLCIVANDTVDYKTEMMLLILPAPIGPRQVLRNDYNWLRNSGYAKGASGLYVMSERIKEACTADAVGGRCLAARALWKQQ